MSTGNELWKESWRLAFENIEPLIYSRCSVYVDIEINGEKISVLIDTGAQINCLSYDVCQLLDIVDLIDTSRKGVAKGVGEAEIVGIIPYIEADFHGAKVPLNFTILKAGNITGILGMSMMMFYKMKLDFEKSQMEIMSHAVPIRICEG